MCQVPLDQNNDYYATLEDIAREMGLKTRSTVHQHIQNLIRYGYLQKGDGKQAYAIPQRELDYFKTHHLVNEGLPLQEKIAAGNPIDAIENPNTINPNDLFISPGRYALKVKGDSMIDIGILDGDYVVIQRNEEARNGNIVVALVDKEEATLKRIFYHDTGFVELRPENSGMESQFYPEEMIQVQGRLVGLFRSYA